VLTASIRGARAETVPGADHYLPLRTPQRLVDLLLRSVRFHDLWPLGLKIEAVIPAKIDSTYD
jgi:hypothetical protein